MTQLIKKVYFQHLLLFSKKIKTYLSWKKSQELSNTKIWKLQWKTFFRSITTFSLELVWLYFHMSLSWYNLVNYKCNISYTFSFVLSTIELNPTKNSTNYQQVIRKQIGHRKTSATQEIPQEAQEARRHTLNPEKSR